MLSLSILFFLADETTTVPQTTSKPATATTTHWFFDRTKCEMIERLREEILQRRKNKNKKKQGNEERNIYMRDD